MEAEKLDWKNLPFGYLKTDYNIRTYYKNGAWGKIEVSASEFIDIHMALTFFYLNFNILRRYFFLIGIHNATGSFP